MDCVGIYMYIYIELGSRDLLKKTTAPAVIAGSCPDPEAELRESGSERPVVLPWAERR